MNKALSVIIVAICLANPSNTFALTIPEASRPPVPALIYSPKNTETLIFRGTVEETEDGYGTALHTEKAIYPLLGGDFAMIIGEKVNIIGKVVREGDIDKIVVARVQFNKE